jgi:hypothetical protein
MYAHLSLLSHVVSFRQQYNDTSHTFKQLREILADQFSDTAPKKVNANEISLRYDFNSLLISIIFHSQPATTSTTTPSSGGDSADGGEETTTERYRISRKEFGQILGRNLRGLRKLARLELNDSYNVKTP